MDLVKVHPVKEPYFLIKNGPLSSITVLCIAPTAMSHALLFAYKGPISNASLRHMRSYEALSCYYVLSRSYKGWVQLLSQICM